MAQLKGENRWLIKLTNAVMLALRAGPPQTVTFCALINNLRHRARKRPACAQSVTPTRISRHRDDVQVFISASNYIGSNVRAVYCMGGCRELSGKLPTQALAGSWAGNTCCCLVDIFMGTLL